MTFHATQIYFEICKVVFEQNVFEKHNKAYLKVSVGRTLLWTQHDLLPLNIFLEWFWRKNVTFLLGKQDGLFSIFFKPEKTKMVQIIRWLYKNRFAFVLDLYFLSL